MQHIEDLLKPSENHVVVEETESGFSIEPIDDSEAALVNFQDVARSALRLVSESYSAKPHRSDGMIDLIFFQKTRRAF